MRWTSIFVSAVLALVLTGGAVTFHARFSSPPINVFLLTVESLRADRFTDSVAPRFFAAARDAIAYRSHRSIASWTGPNIVTLLTGISPFEQGVHARGHSIAASNDVVLKRLAREGWDIGSVQAFAKTENFQNLGMPVATGETMEGWLARRELVGTPFFFWHHYLETHLPYDPGDAFLTPNVRFPEQDDPAHERILTVRQRPAVRAGSVAFEQADRPYIEALYDGGIRAFDGWFGRFWRFFNAAGLRENTILIVTADHGEELLERGNVGHASTTMAGTLFEESVRIPLYIWWPERLNVNVAERPSDHRDIIPTVLDALGLADGVTRAGTSLLRQRDDYEWYAMTSKAGFAETDPDDVRDFFAAVVKDRWKLIARTKRRTLVGIELFDLSADPQEQHDKAAIRPAIVAELLPALAVKLSKFVLPKRPAKRVSRKLPDRDAAPNWVFPATSRAVSWDELQGRAYLEWTGNPTKSYVLEYTAGSGPLEVSGRIAVEGTRKDFGTFSRKYWQTWIVPYRQMTVRVRDENGGGWSERLTISLIE